MEKIQTRKCPGCKIILPLREDLDQLNLVAFGRYGVASPECMELSYQVLHKENEYGRPLHARLDAYGVQHPPHAEVQKALGVNPRLVAASKQSVAIHLIALYLMVEKKLPLPEVSAVMDRILSSGVKLEHEELVPPSNLGTMTIADVAKAQTHEEHIKLIWEWSRTAWQAWATVYHAKVKSWYEKYGK